MTITNYIISAIGFGILLFIFGLLVVIVFTAYKSALDPLLNKFAYFRKKKYIFWADIVQNCIKNDFKDEEIIQLLSSNGNEEKDIIEIFKIADSKMKGGMNR